MAWSFENSGGGGAHVSVGVGGARYQRRWDEPGEELVPGTPEALEESSAPQTLQELNATLSRPAHAWMALAGGMVLALALSLVSPWFFFLLAPAALAGAYFIHRRDVARRTFTLTYALDEAAAWDWQELTNGLAGLARSHRIWQIDAEAGLRDGSGSAGASHVVKRQGVSLLPQAPPLVRSNLLPFCLSSSERLLYFFPDRIYVFRNGRYSTLEYATLTFAASEARMIETGSVPPDALVVDHAWRYVNPDGSPDRSKAKNVQLPLIEYGEVTLHSPQGLNLTLRASNHQAVQAAVEPLRRGLAGHHAREAQVPGAVTLPDTPLAQRNPDPYAAPRLPRYAPWAAGACGLLAVGMVPRLLAPAPRPAAPAAARTAAQVAPPRPAPAQPVRTAAPPRAAAPVAAGIPYDPAADTPGAQPPAFFNKAQRAQWWVLHNREMRRRDQLTLSANAAQLRQIEQQYAARRAQQNWTGNPVRRPAPAPAPAPVSQLAQTPGFPAAPNMAPPGNGSVVQTGPSVTAPASASADTYQDPAYNPNTYAPPPPPNYSSSPSYGYSGSSSRSSGSGGYGYGGSSDYSGYSGGRISVRGYTRKDGTYVRPHTRRRRR